MYPEAPFFLFEGMDGYSGLHGDVQTGLKLNSSETKVISLLGKVSGHITEPYGCCHTGGGRGLSHVSRQRAPGQRPALQNTAFLYRKQGTSRLLGCLGVCVVAQHTRAI